MDRAMIPIKTPLLLLVFSLNLILPTLEKAQSATIRNLLALFDLMALFLLLIRKSKQRHHLTRVRLGGSKSSSIFDLSNHYFWRLFVRKRILFIHQTILRLIIFGVVLVQGKKLIIISISLCRSHVKQTTTVVNRHCNA